MRIKYGEYVPSSDNPVFLSVGRDSLKTPDGIHYADYEQWTFTIEPKDEQNEGERDEDGTAPEAIS